MDTQIQELIDLMKEMSMDTQTQELIALMVEVADALRILRERIEVLEAQVEERNVFGETPTQARVRQLGNRVQGMDTKFEDRIVELEEAIVDAESNARAAVWDRVTGRGLRS